MQVKSSREDSGQILIHHAMEAVDRDRWIGMLTAPITVNSRQLNPRLETEQRFSLAFPICSRDARNYRETWKGAVRQKFRPLKRMQ